MSNWKACIPANPKYEGAKNTFWVMNVSVEPHEGASIKVQVHYQNGALANEFITISGDEYKEWAADDNWIYQKVATKLALGTLVDSDMPYISAPVENNTSVHAEAYIQKIQSLQEQLDSQYAKIKTITDILIEKGLVSAGLVSQSNFVVESGNSEEAQTNEEGSVVTSGNSEEAQTNEQGSVVASGNSEEAQTNEEGSVVASGNSEEAQTNEEGSVVASGNSEEAQTNEQGSVVASSNSEEAQTIQE